MSAARIVVLVLLLARAAVAAVTVQATLDPPQVRVGGIAVLEVRVEGAQSAPVPEIPPIDGVAVRYVGPATEVSIVNGEMSQSTTHRYSLTAGRPGTFTIGPVAVTVAGTRHEAAAVTLTALPAGSAEGPPASGEQLRLVLSVQKTQVYLHERVPIRLELRVGNIRVTNLQYPSLPGDGVAIDKLPEQPKQRREQTAQGAFQVLDFATTLTPLRSGTLTIGPASMTLSRLVRARSRDHFFGFFSESQEPVDLQSEPLALTVLPLPDAGRPADFAGAVGRFELEVKAAPLALGVGDPVTITSTIRGSGTLDTLAPPTIAASDDLRVYPVQPSGQATPGQRTFEQVVMPQRAGTVRLPETRLSYFDPEARAYRTVVGPPIALTVQEAAGGPRAPQIVGSAAPRTPAEKLGRDIVFIKDAPGTLRPAGARVYRSLAFWLLQLLPLGAWLAAVAFDRRRQRLTGDVRWARFTRAGRAARQAIAGARRRLDAGDHAAFYDALARAVSEYLSAKLDLPPGGVTADGVGDRLRQHGVPPGVAADLEEFFAICERARFAPTADATGDMQRTLDHADAIVRALERQRRLARPVAAACLLLAVGTHAWAAPPTEAPNTAFFRGNTLYAEERYPEAAAAYEQVVAAGLESGPLYFNLGNAWFKAGDVGRAILAYERARRLMPADPDLLANLGFARTLAGTVDEPSAWTRLVFPLADRFSTDGLLMTASGLWVALMLVLILARLLPATTRAARVAAVCVVVGLVLVVPSAVYRLMTVDLSARAVVIGRDEATVRFEPSANGTAHFQAKPGSLLRIVGAREGWVQVVRGDGRRGWLERDAVAAL